MLSYEYTTIGSVPNSLMAQAELSDDVKCLLSHTLLLTSKSREPRETTEHVQLTSGLLIKFLQRGYAPLPTLEIERAVLESHGLMNHAMDLTDGGVEIGWQLTSNEAMRGIGRTLKSKLIGKEPFLLDEESKDSLLQSDHEVEFLTGWVPRNLGSRAGHWFMPQAPLDTLLESSTLDPTSDRRIDFLVCHPGINPFAIEIDGPEHEAARAIDEVRDNELRAIGIDVIRVGNEEVMVGNGPQLDKVKERFGPVQDLLDSDSHGIAASEAVIDCSFASKVQFAIGRAISIGWLRSNEWEINLEGTGHVEAAGVLDVLRLLRCFDTLYGGRSAPEKCTVKDRRGSTITWVFADGEWKLDDGAKANGDRVTITVERASSPFSTVAPDLDTDFIVRPAFLPVKLRVDQQFGRIRHPISLESYEDAEPVLTALLQSVFRKYKFREQQGKAVFNALRHGDTVVLLPTGAGKSIVYQLAGLLMPGITMVVDPIVALIEDQVPRVAGAWHRPRCGYRLIYVRAPGTTTAAKSDRAWRIPIRLTLAREIQTSLFRGTLQALREISLVNLAVIDEAHCVSEWGHDFRPAYLNLANNLRRFAADSNLAPPPLLALTGTASRAVLKDMLTDLGIATTNSNAVIRPESFDRRELTFEITRATHAQEAQASLRGVLNRIPRKFNAGQSQFFRANGKETASGVVFTRTVNSRVAGLIGTTEEVKRVSGIQPVIYSGGAPRGYDRSEWERRKRENAAAFKDNKVPVLVATKAFGMGIDKPNIRYTVHFGMPDSLESFYQEAGRAGRDQNPAYCVAVFTEYDPERSDNLLDPGIDLAELRTRFDAANADRTTGDDITSALYFHLNTFAGARKRSPLCESYLTVSQTSNRADGSKSPTKMTHVAWTGGGRSAPSYDCCGWEYLATMRLISGRGA